MFNEHILFFYFFNCVFYYVNTILKFFSFFVVKIYESYRLEANYSYACALSWFLFMVIGLLTAFVFRTSKWVYYGEES